VQRFRDRLLRKLSRGMARKVLQTLKAILVEARYEGEALHVEVGKDSKRHKEPVAIPSHSEVRAIFSVLDADPRPAWLRWHAPIATAVHTGMRPSELRGLLWSGVDLRHGTINMIRGCRIDRVPVGAYPRTGFVFYIR
jgi:integrase